MTFKQNVLALKRATALRQDEAMYRELMRDQNLPFEQLDSLQNERAIAHARFAMQNTKFYRDAYSAAGFTLDDLRDPAAFSSLPIVNKSDIRDHFEEFRSTEATAKNSKISTTGGSTGEPLRLLRDLRTPTRTIEWRLFTWWNVDAADNRAVLQRQSRGFKEKLIHNLQWWPSKQLQLDAYRMDDQHIAGFMRSWENHKPRVLIGYVGGIAELARVLERKGISPTPPVAIGVTAAPITPAQRSAIEAVFHAPVYDHYRSAEIPWIAAECAHRDGLHVFADVRKIEVLNSSGAQVSPGEYGEVVATDMTNRVFPLIRYNLGDRTSPIANSCACGLALPRIQAIVGRVSEAIHLPNGQIIAGESLTQTFSQEVDAVRQFQIYQAGDYSITIRCVPGRSPAALADIELAATRVRKIVDGVVPVRVEIVENIPHVGGKIRYILSDVAQD